MSSIPRKNIASMWAGSITLFLASWAFCLAVPRSDSMLRGWPGAGIGTALTLAGAWAFHQSGIGPVEATCAALGLLMPCLPLASALLAFRRTRHSTAQRRQPSDGPA